MPFVPDTFSPSFSPSTVAELVRRGHRVHHEGGDTFGGYQGIWFDREHGTLQGGTEPRKDGAAVGY